MATGPDTKINHWLRHLEFFKEDVGHGCIVMLASMNNDVLNGPLRLLFSHSNERSNGAIFMNCGRAPTILISRILAVECSNGIHHVLLSMEHSSG